MALKPLNFGPFLRGVHAETDPFTIPKGAVSRASNLIMTNRGALTDCDGSAIINWLNGAIQTTAGRFLEDFLFAPTGVNSYYLAIKQALDRPLGAVANLAAADGGAGGSLAAGTYFYIVTAIDGVGGETMASAPANITIAANHKVNLSWNTVPGAFGYNIYRGPAAGEILLSGLGLPVPQPYPLTLQTTFVDLGNAVAFSQTPSLTNSFIQGGQNVIQYSFPSSAFASFPAVGTTVDATGFTPASLDGIWTILAVSNNPISGAKMIVAGGLDTGVASVEGNISAGNSPPGSDTTSQTALFVMPSGPIPVSYTSANIVAYFPRFLNGFGQAPSGGAGGGGTTGPGITGQGSSTPSGGVVGLVSILPQMVQFTNRVAIALGNGYPPQLYSDATGTSVNPAFGGVGGTAAPITSVSVSHDQVTVTTSATLTSTNLPVGSGVILTGMSDASYDGVFQVLSVSGSTFKIRNPNASGGASTGSFIVSTTPITNTFLPAYPPWAASSQYAVNSIIQPNAIPETYYFKATQGGESSGTEPIWTNAAVLGQQIADGTIIWTNQGSIQSSAPPPPGAGHIVVYAGSLWVLNTYPSNTTSGLDGPCSIRMSDVDNPISWNPINQAFLDKDDGTEGMGFATFTISAQGIPPEGSLVAFKNYAGYQIVGVFGSSNFSIQRIRSDMGCFAPRSIWFVPGYGVARYAHLGVALFDGVQDTVISEEMRPYLFPTNDYDVSDITVADANWIPAAQGCLTANPPMYVMAIPIGNSAGALTRILNYDLVLKCWGGPIDLPSSISAMTQVRPISSNPLTIFGGLNDGTMQRWQAGDAEWYTGSSSVTPVVWSVQTPEAFGNPQDQKLQWRRIAIRGVQTSGSTILTVTPYVNGVAKPSRSYTIPAAGDFEVFCGPKIEGLRFHAVISGSGHLELSRFDFQIYLKAVGTPLVIS
jgi:hypothetical protein